MKRLTDKKKSESCKPRGAAVGFSPRALFSIATPLEEGRIGGQQRWDCQMGTTKMMGAEKI